MNLILLKPDQVANDLIHLDERQSDHANKILKVSVGDRLEIGLVDGMIGFAYVQEVRKNTVILCEAHFDRQSPKQLPLTLLLALPRPQMIKRILQTVACMGVKNLYLFHSEKVEKSFWQSPVLSEASIQQHLTLGLEQAKATQLPRVIKKPKIKHFLEDDIETNYMEDYPKGSSNEYRYIAHPGLYQTCPIFSNIPLEEPTGHYTIAIGPEGGFTSNELKLFQTHEFVPIQFGERILKVETAITCLLSRFI